MSGALSDREQMVLRYRYGFHDGQMHDVQETATRYCVTPARIDQIELRALRRLDWECFYGQARVLRAIAQALQESE
jgi:RNA polymerase primary sigma factor